MIKKQPLFIFLLSILSFHAIFSQQEGFVAGTLVKTPNGYTSIEQLQIGDTVIGYDQQTGYTERKVLNVIQHEAPYYVKLSLGNIICGIGTHQKFYLSNHNAWTQARHLKPGDLLSPNNNNYVIQVEHIQSPISLYALTVELHSFCITTADIVVHNIEPIITSYGIATIMVTGTIANPVGATLTGAMAIGLFVYKIWKSRVGKSQRDELVQAKIHTSFNNQTKNPQMPTACPPQSSGGSSTVPPDDPEKDKDTKENFFERLKKKSDKQARSKRFGKLYRDPKTRLWWSRDRAAHGGSCYKVFKEGTRGFEWLYDANEIGKQIIGKHKGPTGIFISYKEVIF